MHNWRLLCVLLILLVCSTAYGFKSSSSSSCLKSIYAGSVHNLYIDSPDTKLSCRRVADDNLDSKCGWHCLSLNYTHSSTTSAESFLVKRYQPLARFVRKPMAAVDKSGNSHFGPGSVLHSAKLAMARCEQLLDVSIAEPVRWTTSTVCNGDPTRSKVFSQMLNRHSFSRATTFTSEDSEILSWRCNRTFMERSNSESSDSEDSTNSDVFESNSLLIEGRSRNSRLFEVLKSLEREMEHKLCREENTSHNRDLEHTAEIARRHLTMLAQSSAGSHSRSLIVMDSLVGWMGLVLGISTLTCCSWKRKGRGCWWNFVCGCDCNRQGSPSDIESGTPPNRVVSDFSDAMLDDVGDRKSGTKQTAETYRVEPFSLAGLSTATDGFNEKNKVGAGSFGSVYRGLMFDGRVVAIKRAEHSKSSNPQHRQRTESARQRAFEAELQVLSRLHHKHLVNLLGFCDERNERLLVYEFMTNGTLHDHLHSHRHTSRTLLSWQIRMRLALQAARGIEYLHLYAEPPIIHRDIKSSNILLDARWSARVSDFGLSLIFSDEDRDDGLGGQVITTKGTAGTVGYVDPEYYRLRHLTTKSDVYSYGVVIMELLTGKKAIYRRGAGYASLVDHAVPSIEAGELTLILDPRVPPPTTSEISGLGVMADVGKQCVMLLGRDRPSMTEVIRRLEHAVTISRPPGAPLSIFGAQIGSTSEPSSVSPSESKSDHPKKTSSEELYSTDHNTLVTELGSHEFDAVMDSVQEIEVPAFDIQQPAVRSSSTLFEVEGDELSGNVIYEERGESTRHVSDAQPSVQLEPSNVVDPEREESSANVLRSQPAVRFSSNVFDSQRSSSLLEEIEETSSWWHQLQLRLTMAGFDFSSGDAAAEGNISDDPPSQGSAVAGFARFGDSGPPEDIIPRAPQPHPSPGLWPQIYFEGPQPSRVPQPAAERPQASRVQPQPSLERPQAPRVRPQPSLERPQASRVQPQPSLERPQAPQRQPQPSLERTQAPQRQPPPSLERRQAPREQPQPSLQRPQASRGQPHLSLERPQASRVQSQASVERPQLPRMHSQPSLERPQFPLGRTQLPRVQSQTSLRLPRLQPQHPQESLRSQGRPQVSRVQRQFSLQTPRVQRHPSLERPQSSRLQQQFSRERPRQPSPVQRRPSLERSQPSGQREGPLDVRYSGSNSRSSTMSMSLFEGEGVSDIDNVDIEEFLNEYLEPQRTQGAASYAGHSVHQDLEDLMLALEQDHRVHQDLEELILALEEDSPSLRQGSN